MKTKILVLIVAIGMFSCKKLDAPRELPSSTSKASKVEFFNQGVQKLPEFEPGVILIKFKDNSTQRAVAKTQLSKATYRHSVAMKKSGDNGYYKMPVSIGSERKEAALLKAFNDVLWAEPNYSVQTQAVNDPYYNSSDLWGSFTINQPQSWEHGNFGKQSVMVQVIDEPILTCHEELKDQFAINPYEIPSNGIDDDGNGYIDDINGWNFVNNTPTTYMGASLRHGTHVSGTIGARRNNSKGLVGVSPHITMLATPFLGLGGGWIDNAAMAVDYGTGMKILHPETYNISHSSNSWGGGTPSAAFGEALTRAANADIGFVCAAGNNNSNNDLIDFSPASYTKTHDNVEVVMASDWSNNRASFSNYGKTTVDIAAPGTGILSTVPNSTNGSGYASFSGTSMATPHIAGAIALLRAIHPTWTFIQCKDALNASATPLASLTNYCTSGGILNLNHSIFWGVTNEVQPERDCFPTPINDIKPTTPQNFRFNSVNGASPYGIGPDELAYMSFAWDASTHPDGLSAYEINLDPNWVWATAWWSTLTGMPIQDYDMYIRARSTYGIYSDTSIHLRVTADQLRSAEKDLLPPYKLLDFDIYETGQDADLGRWARMRWTIPSPSDPEGNFWRSNIWMKKGTEAARHIGSVYATTSSVRIAGLEQASYTFWVESEDTWFHKGEFSNSDTCSFGVAPPPPPPPPTEDIISPVVTIQSPQDGYIIPVKGNRNVKINFSATDNVGVTLRQIVIDGVIVATGVSSYTWNSNKAASGDHVITCRAFDAAGNIGSKSVTVIKK